MTWLIALILLLAPPADPQLHAAMTSPTSAIISWTQTTRGCLYREQSFIACYEAPGRYRVTLGGPETDWTARPRAGDVITLETGGRVWEARARWWRYLPGVLR